MINAEGEGRNSQIQLPRRGEGVEFPGKRDFLFPV